MGLAMGEVAGSTNSAAWMTGAGGVAVFYAFERSAVFVERSELLELPFE